VDDLVRICIHAKYMRYNRSYSISEMRYNQCRMRKPVHFLALVIL
jgi:hypothetical protein